MNKRRFLLYSMLSAVALPGFARAGAYQPARGAEDIQARWKEFLADGADVALDPAPLSTPHEAWRRQLPADSYAVLFEEDTEIRNSTAARAGRVFAIRCRARWEPQLIAATAWCAPKCIAADAARISDMCFRTARHRPGCAIASMASH